MLENMSSYTYLYNCFWEALKVSNYGNFCNVSVGRGLRSMIPSYTFSTCNPLPITYISWEIHITYRLIKYSFLLLKIWFFVDGFSQQMFLP